MNHQLYIDYIGKRFAEVHLQLIMILWGPKCDAIEHEVFGKYARGVPQLFVLTFVAPLRTSEGTSVAALDQNQTFMNEFVRSMANLRASSLSAFGA